jgi:trehalose synthase-fused probable maltokinase
LAQLLPGGAPEASELTERSMGVEQSNTSVALGDRLLLKIYRLLEPGINPEVEVLIFLTEHGFAHAPVAAGSLCYVTNDAEPATAGILQSLVAAQGDAWSWMLEHLDGPAAEPQAAILAASRIGAVTVALHEALQSDPERPDFPSRPAADDERRAWHAGARAGLDAALAAASDSERKRLSRVAGEVRDTFDALLDAPGAWISRIHGDYHLGQLLVTDDGFVITDFEGEPARPIAERRRPASPLRDVAGMLRSLDYAARTAQRSQTGFDADGWLDAARGAFLTAYGDATDPALLRAFELEKACYEIRYEANFRPDWAWLPLGAIERMVA